MAEEIVTEHKKKLRISWKAVGIIAGAAAAVIAVIVGIVLFSNWRNNGTAYAQKLGEEVGASVETAQRYAHITLQTASSYSCINMAAEEYPHLFESTRKTEVLGVRIPQWVIYIGETKNVVTEVRYYDYKQLQKFGTGVKADQKIDIQGITNGMNQDAVHQFVGFQPLCTAYSSAGITESYKYWCKDANTDTTFSYTLRVEYEDGIVKNVDETEDLFIVPVLKVK
ncbi:MAG: hypothetical protein K6F80_00210 [Oscillospiraceae bacterium]|nr:hypothetical protein [Oscillospiraceae bacterium]